MNYRPNILGMARYGAFYTQPTTTNPFMTTLQRDFESTFVYPKWVLLRETTIRRIISGHLQQSDSSITTAITLATNIPRRSMEYITPQPPTPVEDTYPNDEDYVDADDDDANNIQDYEEQEQEHEDANHNYMEDDPYYAQAEADYYHQNYDSEY